MRRALLVLSHLPLVVILTALPTVVGGWWTAPGQPADGAVVLMLEVSEPYDKPWD